MYFIDDGYTLKTQAYPARATRTLFAVTLV